MTRGGSSIVAGGPRRIEANPTTSRNDHEHECQPPHRSHLIVARQVDSEFFCKRERCSGRVATLCDVPTKRGVVLAEVIRVLPRRVPLSRRTVRDSQKWRILEGITEVVAKKGYAEANVADVIAVAGVSRRSFYEHFTDKEDCFLTAYDVLSDRLIAAMAAAGSTKHAGPARRRAQIEKFIAVLEHDPLSARVFMVDVLSAGLRALHAREDVNARFAVAVLGPSITGSQRAAIVGGVNAVIVGKLLQRRFEELPGLAGPLCSFIERALRT